MIQYRSFLNTDPPLIVDIWQQQNSIRGQVEKMSRQNLDHFVLSKPYFDSAGLILAVDLSGAQPRPLGFVHAGFAPNDQMTDLNPKVGVISQLKIVPTPDGVGVAGELIKLACEYLKARGAERAHVGTDFPFGPFYLGLYGGSQIPGVLVEDVFVLDAFRDFGFQEDDQIAIFERQLSSFKTVIDRKQMSLRRQYQINAVADPLEKSWWESCTLGMSERDRFSLYHKSNQAVCGSVSFWDVQPLAQRWGHLARGMYDLIIPQACRGSGLATFLVGESLRHLMQQGIGIVEAQTRVSDKAAIGVFEKVGFTQVSSGVLMSIRL